MSKQTTGAERSFFSKLCSILIDVLIVPVVVIAFVCAILMTTAKSNNQVPSILGNSIVEVLTNSMDVEGGYKVGEVLIIDQSVNPNSLKVGDCIAFYAPKQSGYTTDNGDSLIVFHRIVRIVYARENKNGNLSAEPVRHFVCHGDNDSTPLTYVPTQKLLDDDPEPGGDYERIQVGEDYVYQLKENGGYVVKLEDDTDVANTNSSVQASQSRFQYVTDEYVVGVLKSRAGGFISGLVNFCCSTTGIVILVIVPSMLMIFFVISGMVQEAKVAKSEKDGEKYAYANNINLLDALSKDENPQPQAEQNKTQAKPEQTAEQIVAQATSVAPKTEQIEENAKKATAPKINQIKASKVPTDDGKNAQTSTPPKAPTAPKAPSAPKVVKDTQPKTPSAKTTTPKAPSTPTAPKAPSTPKAPSAPKAPKTPSAPKAPPKAPNVPPKKQG